MDAGRGRELVVLEARASALGRGGEEELLSRVVFLVASSSVHTASGGGFV